MEEQITFSNDATDRAFQQVMASFDAPAYIRRARRMHAALDALIGDCRRRRAEMLLMAGVHLGTLHGMAGSWEALRPWLAGTEQIDALQLLWDEMQPALEVPIQSTRSPRKLRAGLRMLIPAIEQFNTAWSAWLPTVDVSEVNRLREGYNRYYVLEKECAVRSLAIARQGFQSLPPLTTAELFAHLPLLPVPRMAVDW